MGFQEFEVLLLISLHKNSHDSLFFASMDCVFTVEMWDKDTITSDDFIGGANFTLRDISKRHTVPWPNVEPFKLTLLDKKGNGNRYLLISFSYIPLFFFKLFSGCFVVATLSLNYSSYARLIFHCAVASPCCAFS